MLTELKSKALPGLLYVRMKDAILTDTGVKLTNKEIENLKTNKELRDLYTQKLLSGDLYDYAFAKKTGAWKRIERDTSALEDTRASLAEEEDNKKVLVVLRAILFVVGIGCIFLSASNTTQHLIKFFNGPVALVASCTMILFTTGSLNGALLLFKKKHYMLSIPLVFLFFMVTAFSMFSTLDVLYSAYQRNEAVSIVASGEASKQSRAYAVLSDDIKRNEESKKRLVEQYNKYISGDKVLLWKVSEYEAKIAGYDKTISSLTKKQLDVLGEASVDVSKEVKTKTKTIYDELSERTGGNVTAGTIQLIQSLFPALFIDIMAPLSFATIIFLGKENSSGKRRKKSKADV